MSNRTILLVEDNRDDEFLTLWMLKKAGFTNITIARDGSEALTLLHGNKLLGIREVCAPDIIILDLQLPKISGLEVLREIRSDERTKDIDVFILTSSNDPKDRNECCDLGVTAFFSKPPDESIFQIFL
ncbi:MAG: response regulator [Candidatus Riflebacteria bacterium]|nr:response regulator [Candidatus Riflebacteria bacterium]